jgi:hypothetical protein
LNIHLERAGRFPQFGTPSRINKSLFFYIIDSTQFVETSE